MKTQQKLFILFFQGLTLTFANSLKNIIMQLLCQLNNNVSFYLQFTLISNERCKIFFLPIVRGASCLVMIYYNVMKLTKIEFYYFILFILLISNLVRITNREQSVDLPNWQDFYCGMNYAVFYFSTIFFIWKDLN